VEHINIETIKFRWDDVNGASKVEMGPDLIRPKAIFFDPKGKKLTNLTCLGEIFQILTQTING